MPQKPPDLDRYGNPISALKPGEKPPDLDAYGLPLYPEEQKSALRLAHEWASRPITTAPAEAGKGVSEWITTPTLATSPTGQGGLQDYLAGTYARAKGFVGGAAEGVGNLVTGLSTPYNIALALATGGTSIAEKQGLAQIARLGAMGARALSVPFAVEGAQNVLSPQSTLAERGMGLAELAGGVAGIKYPMGRKLTPAEAAKIPRGKQTKVIVDGKEIPVEVEAPTAAAPTVSEAFGIPEGTKLRTITAEESAIAEPTLPFEAPPGPTQLPLPVPTEFENLTRPRTPAAPLPVQQAINPEVAKPIAAGKPATFEDILGPGPFDAKLAGVDGIVEARKAGKITPVQAVQLLEKYHNEQLLKPKVKAAPAKVEAPPTKVEAPPVAEVTTPVVQELKAKAQAAKVKVQELRAKKAEAPPTPEIEAAAAIEEAAKPITEPVTPPVVEAPPVAEVPKVVETPPVATTPEGTPVPKTISKNAKIVLGTLGYDRSVIEAMDPVEALRIIRGKIKAIPKPTGGPRLVTKTGERPKTAVEIATEVKARRIAEAQAESTAAKIKATETGEAPLVTEEGVEIPPFKPVKQLPDAPGVGEIVKRIPKVTGNEELDGMLRAWRGLRIAKNRTPFNPQEIEVYNNLKKNIMNHPALSEDLRQAWIKAEFTKPPTTPIEVPPHAGVEKTMNIIPREQASADFINNLKSEGWIFDGLTNRGDYRFRKGGVPTEEALAPKVISRPREPINVEEIKSPKAKLWAQMVNELDAAKAPDKSYRAVLATGAKEQLKRGDSWREKVIRYIEYVKQNEKGELIITKKAKPDILKTTPEGSIILLKKGKAESNVIKRLVEEGFKFINENEVGDLRFQKIVTKGNVPVLESEVGLTRPVRPPKRGAEAKLGANQDEMKSSIIAEAFNFPRGLLASWDFSAPLRQGLPLIHKREFWKALKPMWESWMTEEGFQASQYNIAKRALFKRRIDQNGNVIKSFAEMAGLKLTDLLELSSREEHIMSTWAESGGMFERNKWMAAHGGTELAKAYRATIGAGVRKSNRAYVAFLNNLRADTFESLMKSSGALVDVEKNIPLTRALADFVNMATGRGSLGKFEQSAVILNTGLFAPRLIAARLKMLSPYHYWKAPPPVRQEILKSLFAIATTGNIVLQLAKMAGAEVSTDPNSADFGKAKIGNTRIDPWGGFQQYIVAANRLMRPKQLAIPGFEGGAQTGIVPIDMATSFLGTGGQRVTSTTSNKQFDLWNPQGPYEPTSLDILGRFGRGKLHPVLGFAFSLLAGQKEMSGQPMNFATLNPMDNAVMQRFVPILMQDVYQLAQENPELLPLAIPGALGMGIQTYQPQQ